MESDPRTESFLTEMRELRLDVTIAHLFCIRSFKKGQKWNSLVVQWLGLRASIVEGASSISGRGTKIPQAAGRGPKKTGGPERFFPFKERKTTAA